MEKRTNRKQRDFSIRLKTSFAVQVHIEELEAMVKIAYEAGLSEEERATFIDIMHEALFKSIATIFPTPFDA